MGRGRRCDVLIVVLCRRNWPPEELRRLRLCIISLNSSGATISFMPTDDIVALLVTERDKLNRAIEALGAPVKRRGRPAKTARSVAAVPSAPTKRKPMTAAEKKALSVKMKAAWAKRKKATEG